MYKELGVFVSLQTLATYELGTRNMPIQRFSELCFVLRKKPSEVMAEVEERVSRRPDELTIDLRRVAQCSREDLRPLRDWARAKLVRHRGQPVCKEVITLTREALGTLSELCGGVDIATALHDA